MGTRPFNGQCTRPDRVRRMSCLRPHAGQHVAATTRRRLNCPLPELPRLHLLTIAIVPADLHRHCHRVDRLRHGPSLLPPPPCQPPPPSRTGRMSPPPSSSGQQRLAAVLHHTLAFLPSHRPRLTATATTEPQAPPSRFRPVPD